ncbi:hypothetical protein DFH07DRAFT_557295 [Mycena maculata]|uniref:Uncharacterized protein n=1 Tax=Mycena maculata TaxID=230809 RepID=A0AAD7N7J7_9AGAR|nr:hypothetical protein DFH07DRAFT_557295 [Mycena maculata]
MSKDVSPLGPVDETLADELAVVAHDEQEKSAPWIVRKLVGSITGRIVMSSYESLRAAGTSVVCLSPNLSLGCFWEASIELLSTVLIIVLKWGDSSPLLLPCIRFRDLAVHTVIAATGGMAVVAAPVLGPISAEVISMFGDTILVELGIHAGFEVTEMAANDLFLEAPIQHVIPIHSKRLESTGIKELVITLKYKITMTDAALGFYRSSVHKDTSLFAAVKDYLAIEKGWFSPYLFASGRRPIIPRSMKPDIVFCHGPFLEGDYRVGQTMLAESALVIALCAAPPPTPPKEEEHHTLSIPKLSSMPSLTNVLRSRPPSPHEPEHTLAVLPTPPTPRRMVIACVGLKPHRTLWSTSARPGESVIRYILFNGCPAIVIPVKVGAPLVAWDTLTLEELWKVELPADDPEVKGTTPAQGKYGGIVNVFFEYLDMCVDWERVIVPGNPGPSQADGREVLKSALGLLVAAAVRSGNSKQVKKEIDKERSGIAMWRIP